MDIVLKPLPKDFSIFEFAIPAAHRQYAERWICRARQAALGERTGLALALGVINPFFCAGSSNRGRAKPGK